MLIVLSSHFLFFFSLRPPPTSTLFPYTTLFRSARREGDFLVRVHRLAFRLRIHRAVQGSGPRHRRHLRCPQGIADRKSTRLNSSHLGISYAVFCLKKKKKEK